MRLKTDPSACTYPDLAITPAIEGQGEKLEMFELNDTSRQALQKAPRHSAVVSQSVV